MKNFFDNLIENFFMVVLFIIIVFGDIVACAMFALL